MRFVVQRVTEAAVTIDGKIVGQIGKGLLVLIGVCDSDTPETADLFVRKLLGLRIFEDAQGKTNLSLKDVGGELLLVSQFTLYANCRKGNRPSYFQAAGPEEADALYRKTIELIENQGIHVEEGVFQAEMMVEIHNDGPVTILMDSHKLF